MSIREFFKPVRSSKNISSVTNLVKTKNYEKPKTTNELNVAPKPPIQQQVQIPVQTDPNLRSFDEIRILFLIF